MTFIVDLAKKLAGEEPAHWSVDKYTDRPKSVGEDNVIEVNIVYRLTPDQAAMLHVIDEVPE
jgi:hypothetical protein